VKKSHAHLSPDSYYELTDFTDRSFSANWKLFVTYYKRGFSYSENMVAQMSSVSIFGFVDRHGVITEMGKFVNEMVLVPKQEDDKA